MVVKQSIPVHMRISLDGLRGELQRALQRTIFLASAGLQNVELINAEKLQLPTNSIPASYASNLKWTSEEAQNHFRKWVVINGFRDSIESVSAFLESAHQVLSIWELVEKQKEGHKITGSEWKKVINICASEFHHFGLPNKVDHIKKRMPLFWTKSLHHS